MYKLTVLTILALTLVAQTPTGPASRLDDLATIPIETVAVCAKGQQRCGTAGCYDPSVSCCCFPKANSKIIRKPRNGNTCVAACRNAAKKQAR